MIASHLESSLTLLQKAFPKGISEEEYFTLLDLLYEDFSDRNLAELISYFHKKEYSEVMNDIYSSQSTKKPLKQSVNTLKERMKPFGYDEWKQEE